jgi:hypothetical protein
VKDPIAFESGSGERLVVSFTGKVKNGVVLLAHGVHLAEGQQVEVVAAPTAPQSDCLHDAAVATVPWTATDLPDDLAANHDYYLHGGKKREPRRGRWIPDDHPIREMTEAEAAAYTEQLIRFAAETRNLPPDLATNHNHYLHGLPKA